MTARTRRVAAAAGVVYVAALGVLVLWPRGGSVRRLNLDVYLFFLHHGVPPSVTPEVYGIVSNILVFVPLTFVPSLIVDRISPWWWAVAGTAMSAAAEVIQSFLPARVPSILDVATNALGSLIGVALAVLLRRRMRHTRSG